MPRRSRDEAEKAREVVRGASPTPIISSNSAKGSNAMRSEEPVLLVGDEMVGQAVIGKTPSKQLTNSETTDHLPRCYSTKTTTSQILQPTMKAVQVRMGT